MRSRRLIKMCLCMYTCVCVCVCARQHLDLGLGLRETDRERQTEVDLLFHLFMHSLVASCMCPGGRLSPRPWCIGTVL